MRIPLLSSSLVKRGLSKSGLKAIAIFMLGFLAVSCSEREVQPITEYSLQYETFFSVKLNKKDFDAYRDTDAMRISGGNYAGEMAGELLEALALGVVSLGVVKYQPKIPVASDIHLIILDSRGHEISRQNIYWGDNQFHEKIKENKIFLYLAIYTPMLRKTVYLGSVRISEYYSRVSFDAAEKLNKLRNAAP